MHPGHWLSRIDTLYYHHASPHSLYTQHPNPDVHSLSIEQFRSTGPLSSHPWMPFSLLPAYPVLVYSLGPNWHNLCRAPIHLRPRWECECPSSISYGSSFMSLPQNFYVLNICLDSVLTTWWVIHNFPGLPTPYKIWWKLWNLSLGKMWVSWQICKILHTILEHLQICWKPFMDLRLRTSTLTEVSEASILFPFVSPGTVQHVAHSRCLTNAW